MTTTPVPQPPAAPDGLIPLAEAPGLAWGLIRVSGADAVSFLQGQLTQDVAGLAPGIARWAGYCSAKGRLIANARIWRTDADVCLALSAELAGPMAKRLSMFVLRAKARVEDCSGSVAVWGVLGERAMQRVQHWLRHPEIALEHAHLADHPSLGHDDVLSTPNGTLIGLPPSLVHDSTESPTGSGPIPRGLLMVPVAAVDALPADWRTPRENLQAAWALAEVFAAVPRIGELTRECFVPQMVNFESVGGVSFTKGCYPGQEVVARSQYLGKLRRRMFLGVGAGAVPPPGSDILAPGQLEPCGQVVMAAAWVDLTEPHRPTREGTDALQPPGFALLFECKSELADSGQLRTAQGGTADQGSAIRRLPLPYSLQSQD